MIGYCVYIPKGKRSWYRTVYQLLPYLKSFVLRYLTWYKHFKSSNDGIYSLRKEAPVNYLWSYRSFWVWNVIVEAPVSSVEKVTNWRLQWLQRRICEINVLYYPFMTTTNVYCYCTVIVHLFGEELADNVGRTFTCHAHHRSKCQFRWTVNRCVYTCNFT